MLLCQQSLLAITHVENRYLLSKFILLGMICDASLLFYYYLLHHFNFIYALCAKKQPIKHTGRVPLSVLVP